ncbi:MAG: hypothetical protein J7L50_03210 [Candidatus Odinarchaeota archaeon]|nr:hypothetical protein [Candidatus Odinarchaeota archaeon]
MNISQVYSLISVDEMFNLDKNVMSRYTTDLNFHPNEKAFKFSSLFLLRLLMLEHNSIRKLIEECIFESAPYVCNLKWVKKVLSRKFKNVEEAKSYLRGLISKCEDMTKKTDIRIILTKLEAKTCK